MTPASFQSFTNTPDPLIVGQLPIASEKGTLVTPESRLRGTVMGQVTLGAATAEADAGNTGQGAMSAVVVGAGAKVGVYHLACIEPGAGAGKFLVEDPDGNVVGVATVAVEFSAGGLTFTIADGDPDFVAGDSFTITVAEGSLKWKISASAATDGSSVPAGILAEDADASAADVECLIYTRGDFSEDAITIGTGHTLDTIRATLRAIGVHLVPVQG